MRRATILITLSLVVLFMQRSGAVPGSTDGSRSESVASLVSAVYDTGTAVGIDTASPLQTLDVNGNIRVNQHIYSGAAYTGFLTDGNAALPIKAGSLALSSAYSSVAPTNGLFVQGQSVFGTTNGAQISAGLIAPSTLGDDHSLEYHGTKLNVGALNSTSYSPANTAVVNIGGYGDLQELLRIRTNQNTGYVTLSQASLNTFNMNFVQNNVSQMYLAGGGNIGIGTTAPATKLHVVGDVTVTGNIAAKYQDVAEWVPAHGALAAGTVVVVAQDEANVVEQSSREYDTAVAGVISAQPGISLGEASDSKVLVAHTGRVRVNVDASFGAVKAGDLLVTSPVPGYAMRSTPVVVGQSMIHRPGTLLGKALESLRSGRRDILVLLTLQ
jgi:hypothetical protein